MSEWLIFILSLPGSNAASRMKVWRGLKAQRAGVLRDGVYLLPLSGPTRKALAVQTQVVNEAGGTAEVLECTAVDDRQERAFRALFDLSEGYTAWSEKAMALRDGLNQLDEAGARREEAQLRRALGALEAVDYFPGEARSQARLSMQDVAARINARFSPDEPSDTTGSIRPRQADHYQGRLWATRKQLWVDRVASAWLIGRFIDSRARFEWLDSPSQCVPDAVGFDFDGAEFTHVGHRVTFEVLLASFGLELDDALARIGALVHYLDAGGVPVPEASGIVALLGGARRRCPDDDGFLDTASTLFDDLYAAYQESVPAAASPTAKAMHGS